MLRRLYCQDIYDCCYKSGSICIPLLSGPRSSHNMLLDGMNMCVHIGEKLCSCIIYGQRQGGRIMVY